MTRSTQYNFMRLFRILINKKLNILGSKLRFFFNTLVLGRGRWEVGGDNLKKIIFDLRPPPVMLKNNIIEII